MKLKNLGWKDLRYERKRTYLEDEEFSKGTFVAKFARSKVKRHGKYAYWVDIRNKDDENFKIVTIIDAENKQAVLDIIKEGIEEYIDADKLPKNTKIEYKGYVAYLTRNGSTNDYSIANDEHYSKRVFNEKKEKMSFYTYANKLEEIKKEFEKKVEEDLVERKRKDAVEKVNWDKVYKELMNSKPKILSAIKALSGIKFSSLKFNYDKEKDKFEIQTEKKKVDKTEIGFVANYILSFQYTMWKSYKDLNDGKVQLQFTPHLNYELASMGSNGFEQPGYILYDIPTKKFIVKFRRR